LKRSVSVRCRARGCKLITKHQTAFCDLHFALRYQHLKIAVGHDSDAHSFYNSRRWRACSKSHRAKQPLCINYEVCRGMAQVVDHIIPIRLGGNCWEQSNMQSMCNRCHNLKRQQERQQHIEARRNVTSAKGISGVNINLVEQILDKLTK
jgi:hypothetical protein